MTWRQYKSNSFSTEYFLFIVSTFLEYRIKKSNSWVKFIWKKFKNFGRAEINRQFVRIFKDNLFQNRYKIAWYKFEHNSHRQPLSSVDCACQQHQIRSSLFRSSDCLWFSSKWVSSNPRGRLGHWVAAILDRGSIELGLKYLANLKRSKAAHDLELKRKVYYNLIALEIHSWEHIHGWEQYCCKCLYIV